MLRRSIFSLLSLMLASCTVSDAGPLALSLGEDIDGRPELTWDTSAGLARFMTVYDCGDGDCDDVTDPSYVDVPSVPLPIDWQASGADTRGRGTIAPPVRLGSEPRDADVVDGGPLKDGSYRVRVVTWHQDGWHTGWLPFIVGAEEVEQEQ